MQFPGSHFKPSIVFGVCISLPIVLFIYFGYGKLNSALAYRKLYAEAEFIQITSGNPEFYLPFTKLKFKAFDDKTLSYLKNSKLFNSFISNGLPLRRIHFDPRIDVLVLLHIQKTGGSSFGRLLALEISDLNCHKVKNGRKQRDCSVSFSDTLSDNRRSIWMFSRFSVGWACGLHADWTELNSCVSKILDSRESFNRTRRYHYITLLREPVSRYISEWRHMARGATWAGAELRCNGRQASLAEVPFCYEGSNWRGVTLNDFVNCESNLANNRQTRMTADLSLVNCYNKSGMEPAVRSEKIISSALTNLGSFAFIGLSEYQELNQWLFERIFVNLRLKVKLTQKETKAEQFLPTISSLELQRIREVNSLDLILYEFAKSLYFQRIVNVSKSLNESIVDKLSPSILNDYLT